MKSRLINLLKFVVGWPLSFVALYFIYTTFAAKSGGMSLAMHIQYPLLGVALICFILYYAFRSYIWLKLLQYQGHRIPFRESSFLWLSAQLKRYIPGNLWSFVGLAVSYGEHKVTKKDLAYAVLIESELVIIVTFILSLLCVPFILTNFIHVPLSAETVTLILFVLFIIGAVIYVWLGSYLREKKGKVFTVLRHMFSKFTPSENLTLLLLMTGSYVMYALGYYFSISSVVTLNPDHFLVFLGIFLFSLVAGYLSVITPTGLGVREGFIALGLSKFIPAGVAGFAAIFSRVIIVLAELLTLLLSYLWYKSGTRFHTQEKFLAARLHEIILGISIVLFTMYFTLVSFLRYTEYYTGRFDLGNMAQTVWNTSQGRIFMITDPNGIQTVSRLAFHADFILVLLAPLYALWSDPRMLLLVQTVIVALGAVFVYLISRYLIKDKTVSLLFAISYLANPSIERATLYDFHAVVLATTFLLGATYFLLKKKYLPFLLLALLAALTKEQMWFVIALFGPILVFRDKMRLFGVMLFVVCLGMFYYLLWHAIPAAAGASHFALSYFSDGGSSPSDIIKNILFSPADSIQTAIQEDRISYYQKLLLPVGYLPIAFPFWLILASPDLILNIFSDRQQLQQIYYQYTATISAFLYLSAIFGVRTIRTYFPRIPFLFFSLYLAVCTLAGAYLYGPLPGGREPNHAVFTLPQKERESIDRELRSLPREAKVAASNNLASHLSEREHIYVIPHGIGVADYIAIYKVFNNTNNKDNEVLNLLRTDPGYTLYFENSQIVMFRKR